MNQLYHIYTVFTSIFVRALPVQSCEEEYGIKIIYGNEVHLKHVKRLRRKLYAIKKQEKVVFVHGIGKRKHPVQKSIELLEKYMDKLKEYTQKLHKCGKRNSYSKTDEDETFMRLKEDAMLICFFKAIPHKDSAADAPSIFSSECAKRAQLT